MAGATFSYPRASHYAPTVNSYAHSALPQRTTGICAGEPSAAEHGFRMPKVSAGMLLYRIREGAPEVLLVHPGGPFWAKKDAGAWTIPKGECDEGEEPLATALRELREETGFRVDGPIVALGSIRQSGGKQVHAFAAASDVDAAKLVSNTFSLEWPPHSGRKNTYPEVDRAAWFPLEAAALKILPAQAELLDRLAARLRA